MTYLALSFVLCLSLMAVTEPDASEIQWAILGSSILTFAGIVFKGVQDWLAESRRRKWRMEMEGKIEQNTNITMQARDDVRKDQRETAVELTAKVDKDRAKLEKQIAELRATADAAYKEANSVNAKLLMIGEQRLVNDSAVHSVEIVNSPDHPVPVTTPK